MKISHKINTKRGVWYIEPRYLGQTSDGRVYLYFPPDLGKWAYVNDFQAVFFNNKERPFGGRMLHGKEVPLKIRRQAFSFIKQLLRKVQ